MVTLANCGMRRAPRGPSPGKLKSQPGWTALLVQSVALCLLYHADTFTHLARILNHASCAPKPDAFHTHLAAGLRAQFPDFPCADRPTDSPTSKQLLYLLARSYATHAAYFKPPVLSLPEGWCSINVVLTWLYTAALVLPPLRRRLSPSLQAAWLNACLLNDLFVPSICWGLLGSAPPSCVPHYTPSTCEALGYTALVGLPAWMVYLITVYVTGSLSLVTLLLAKHGLTDQVPYSLPSLWVRQAITVVAVVAFTSLRGRIWSGLMRMMAPPAARLGAPRPPPQAALEGQAAAAVVAVAEPPGYGPDGRMNTTVRLRRRDVMAQLSEPGGSGIAPLQSPPPLPPPQHQQRQRRPQERSYALTQGCGAAAGRAMPTEAIATVAVRSAYAGGGAVAEGSSWHPQMEEAKQGVAGSGGDAGPLGIEGCGAAAAAVPPPQQQQQQMAGAGVNSDDTEQPVTLGGGESMSGSTEPEPEQAAAAELQTGSAAGLPTLAGLSRGTRPGGGSSGGRLPRPPARPPQPPNRGSAGVPPQPQAATGPSEQRLRRSPHPPQPRPWQQLLSWPAWLRWTHAAAAAPAANGGGPVAPAEPPPPGAKEAAAPPLTAEELRAMVAAARAAPYRPDPTIQLTRVHLRLPGLLVEELPLGWQQATLARMNRTLPPGYAVLGLTALDAN